MKKIFTALALAMILVMAGAAFAVDQGTPDRDNRWTLGNDGKQWKTLYVRGASAVILEGATADAYETTISVTDPTADRTITVPNASGTLKLTNYTLSTDDTTLTSANCGSTYAIATDAKTFTLPATVAGCEFTFINAGASTAVEILIDTNASDSLFGSCGAVALDVADGHRLKNTKATTAKGDSITIVGDGGASGWFIKSCNGVWADVGS